MAKFPSLEMIAPMLLLCLGCRLGVIEARTCAFSSSFTRTPLTSPRCEPGGWNSLARPLSAGDAHGNSRNSRGRGGNRLAMLADGGVDSSTELERLPDSAVQITIKVSGDETKSAYDRKLKELSKEISIPGFRKGAFIPATVVENHLASKSGGNTNVIKEEAIKVLVGKHVEPAIRDEHKLEPIGQPVLTKKIEELAGSFHAGEELELIVRCDVWPDIKWTDVDDGREKPYYGLKGSYKRKPFNQERFDAALIDLRDRYAELAPMGDDETLDWGDAVVVNMKGYFLEPDGETKGEPLPDAASGDNVEIVLGQGRYMDGLVEGLVGSKAGDSTTVKVGFPDRLKDKTLAGKKAIFDVDIVKSSHRVLPELDDEFAEKVRPGLDLESLEAELRKAVDEEDSKEFIEERNKALSEALAGVVDVEVPDTVVTKQSQEKYAIMMTDMKDGGMADEDIKKMINPENFLKYKDICAPDIIRDFKVSLATEEVARAEGIEVPAYQVDEQIAALKKQAAGGDEGEFDENLMRPQMETALQQRMVYDLLAEHADLDVEYVEQVEQEFDADLMQKLADESMEREKAAAAAAAAAEAEAESME